MDRYEVSDSTDWLQTSLSSFAPVEAALRCQVCKDFFDTPMITSCSHTFCSICIRRCLTSDGRCPTCRAGEQESKLRRNWTVQELVDSYQAARPDLLRMAREASSSSSSSPSSKKESAGKSAKRKLDDTDLKTATTGRTSQQRKTRSQSRRAPDKQSDSTVIRLDDDGVGDYQPEDGLVPCPICQRRMKPEEVYAHLDSCEGSNTSNPAKTNSRSFPTSRQKPSSQRGPPSKPSKPPPERLPKLNYSLMKDGAIRKKFQELGIPSFGSKPLLIKRHSEWVNLWNANCDSSRPRSKRELLQDLDVWERSQGGHAPNATGLSGGGSLMRKDFDGAAWAATHSEDFQQLIKNAKRKKSIPTTDDEHATKRTDEGRSTEDHAKYLLNAAESPVEAQDGESITGEANNGAELRTNQDLKVDSDEDGDVASKDIGGPSGHPIHRLSSTKSPPFMPSSGKKRMFDDVQDHTMEMVEVPQ